VFAPLTVLLLQDHRYQAMVNELAAEYDDDEETESEDEIAVAEARAPAEKRAKQGLGFCLAFAAHVFLVQCRRATR